MPSRHNSLLGDAKWERVPEPMKFRLNDTSLCPPPPREGFVNAAGEEVQRRGHWWAYIEESDTWVFAGDYRGLVESVRQHLITNGLPVPADLDGTVQELICAMVPANWKRGCVASDAQGFSLTVTLNLVRRWAKTMIAYAKDRKLVSQEEAEARAQTCLRCHYRVPITGCKGCGRSLGGLITSLAINRTTPVDDQLTACGVCGCALAPMVHMDNATLDKGSAGLEYPSDIGNGQPCWRRAL